MRTARMAWAALAVSTAWQAAKLEPAAGYLPGKPT